MAKVDNTITISCDAVINIITISCDAASCGFRDLKPENILLSEDMHIQITDFGSAKIVDEVDEGQCCLFPYYHSEYIAQ